MTPQEMEKMLRQTLTDRRLSGGERVALRQALAETKLDPQQAAAYRRQAFVLAKGAVDDPQALAVIDWLEDVVKLLHPVKAAGAAAGPSEALFAPFDDLPARVCRLFQAAERSADICVFTITDDRLADAVLAAHRRGVRVRVITHDDKAADLGSDVARLRGVGVAVRVDRTAAHMHHKFAVLDDAILLNGSYNWTRSAAGANNENLVLSGERLLVDTFARHFEKLWALLGE